MDFLRFSRVGLILFSISLLGCSGDTPFDQLVAAQASAIPSGSILITSNANGTTGPGLISVWSKDGELDRVIYDYTKVGTGYASSLAFVKPSQLFAVTDTGGGASNDFLDLFDYLSPFANPTNLFSSLSSGAANSYMRQMALITDHVTNRYFAFVAEAGNNRVARLSSPIATSASGLNFTRDYNFSANGTCTLATPYGVAEIPGSGNLAIISSAASGRVNIFDQAGNCVGSTAVTNFPTSAAYHAKSGKVLVTYATNGSIMAHNTLTGAASPATAIYTSVAQLSTPRAIATDADGYIYVGSDGLDLVVKLYWDGVSSTATYIGTIIQSSVFTQNVTSITVVP
jgi:hypothetical protein